MLFRSDASRNDVSADGMEDASAPLCGLDAPCGAVANARLDCDRGRCTALTCDTGFANCDGLAATGCEADLRVRSDHCGSGGNVCARATSAAGQYTPRATANRHANTHPYRPARTRQRPACSTQEGWTGGTLRSERSKISLAGA